METEYEKSEVFLMADENLHSLNKLNDEIKSAKIISWLFPKEQRKKIKEIEIQLNHMMELIDQFGKVQ